jgi:hypothetical protein
MDVAISEARAAAQNVLLALREARSIPSFFVDP